MTDIVECLKEVIASDHERGCQGRQYTCICGHDDKIELALSRAFAEIECLRGELSEADTIIEGYGVVSVQQYQKEIARLRAASEWRDISTAPRDGTFILAYQPDRVMDTVAWDVSREGWMNGYDDKKNYPTHWMPLPAPPQRNEVTK